MRIFGTKGVKTHLTTGTFSCPFCKSTQVYALKKVISYYAVFQVPLISSKEELVYVECQGCFNRYIPRVLDYDPHTRDEMFIELYEQSLMHVLAMMVLTDLELSFQKKMVMLSMLKKFSREDMMMEDLDKKLAQVSQNRESTFNKLRAINPLLNRHGRELILKCAVSVASVDGPLNELELVLIAKVADAMGIDSQHLVWLIQENQPKHAAA